MRERLKISGKFLTQRADKSNQTADRLLLAYFHAKQGDDVKALEQFRAALKNDPGNAEAWYQKAVVEARTLDFDAAIADLETALKSQPDAKTKITIAKFQGRLFVRNRQTDKALAVWQQLLEANPKDEDLYEDIIELQISEGLYDQAAELSEQLIAQTTDKYNQVVRRVRLGDIYQRGQQAFQGAGSLRLDSRSGGRRNLARAANPGSDRGVSSAARMIWSVFKSTTKSCSKLTPAACRFISSMPACWRKWGRPNRPAANSRRSCG